MAALSAAVCITLLARNINPTSTARATKPSSKEKQSAARMMVCPRSSWSSFMALPPGAVELALPTRPWSNSAMALAAAECSHGAPCFSGGSTQGSFLFTLGGDRVRLIAVWSRFNPLRGPQGLRQDKRQANAIRTPANHLQLHGNGEFGVFISAVRPLQGHGDQGAQGPALLSEQVQPGRTGVPDAVHHQVGAVPAIGDWAGPHWPAHLAAIVRDPTFPRNRAPHFRLETAHFNCPVEAGSAAQPELHLIGHADHELVAGFGLGRIDGVRRQRQQTGSIGFQRGHAKSWERLDDMNDAIVFVQIDQIDGGGQARGEGMKPRRRHHPEALIVPECAPSDQHLEARRQSIGRGNPQAEKTFAGLVVNAEPLSFHFFSQSGKYPATRRYHEVPLPIASPRLAPGCDFPL